MNKHLNDILETQPSSDDSRNGASNAYKSLIPKRLAPSFEREQEIKRATNEKTSADNSPLASEKLTAEKAVLGFNNSNENQNNSFVLPFIIDSSGLTGRLTILGKQLDDILNRHDYPDSLKELLGQFIAFSATVASSLKYNGTFTVQARGNGLVSLMTVNISANGNMRAYASYDDRLRDQFNTSSNIQDVLLKTLMGKGEMVLTAPVGEKLTAYQTIIPLDRKTLEDTINDYFTTSAGYVSVFRLTSGKTKDGWRGGGISIQKLPRENPDLDVIMERENWRRALILMLSIKNEELLNKDLSAKEILFRLYHNDAIRVFNQLTLNDKCSCSREKMLNVLLSLPFNERADLFDKHANQIYPDGQNPSKGSIDVVVMNCEYCSIRQEFSVLDLDLKSSPCDEGAAQTAKDDLDKPIN